MNSAMQRAALKIYWDIRLEGHAIVREWWQAVWGTGPDAQQNPTSGASWAFVATPYANSAAAAKQTV